MEFPGVADLEESSRVQSVHDCEDAVAGFDPSRSAGATSLALPLPTSCIGENTSRPKLRKAAMTSLTSHIWAMVKNGPAR